MTNRRSRKGKTNPNVTAGIAGAEEVAAELSGNTGAASSLGRREKLAREGSPRRNRTGGMSRPSANFFTEASKPIYPTPISAPMFLMNRQQTVKLTTSGVALGSYYTRDPFRANKDEAIVFEYPQIAWGSFQVATPLTTEPVALQLGLRVVNFFAQFVDVLNFNGRFTPNELLTATTDFTVYLSNFTEAFSILWTYYGVYAALDINTSTKSFGRGIGGANVPRAAELWRRLQLLPIPPGFVDCLSKITGVFYSDIEDFVILGYVSRGASTVAVTDWTLNTGALSVDALLNVAETDIAAMEGTANEANIITALLAMVFGTPAPLPNAYVNGNQLAFDLHFTRSPIFRVAATQFVQPGTNGGGSGGTVPIMIRRGMESDLYIEYAFSLLRPNLYSPDTDGGHATSSQVGLLIAAPNNTQDFSRYYGPNAGANNTILTDASFAALNFGNGTFFEVLRWAAFIQSTAGLVNWSQDSRAYAHWTLYYPNVALLGDQTLIMLEKIFFSGMKVKELA